MQYVWDLKENRVLWIANGIAEDGVTGELFAVDERNFASMFIPIMKSSYHLIIEGISNFYESNMKESKWIEEVNVELSRYGV